MTQNIIGVRFKKVGKIYYFDPQELEIKQFDKVVVETSRGMELGEVALGPREVPVEGDMPIKKVLRLATEDDLATAEYLRRKEEAAWDIFNEKVKNHQLEMKLVDVEYSFDRRKAIFYFTAEGRVDFRELVKDLASVFKIRIELHQIGVRDEAKLFRGLGICGRTTCCAQWLGEFVPVSIKMAKEQNLSLNSTKISGICGRLLCCLNYEHEFYADVTKRMPRVGNHVLTPEGEGDVFKLSILDEAVYVRLTVGDDETEVKKFKLEDVERISRGEGRPRRNNAKTDKRESKPEGKREREKKQPENKETEKLERKGEEGQKRDGNKDRRRNSRRRNRRPKKANQ